MRPAAAVETTSSAAPALQRALERLALAGVVVHAAFLSISVAGMQIGLGVALGALVLLRLTGRRVWARSALDLPVLLLTGAAVLSIALASVTGAPPVGWHEATIWRSFLAGPVVLSALSVTERDGADPGAARRWGLIALCAWAACSLAPSALAWVQYPTGLDPLYALGLRAVPVRAPAPFNPGHYAALGFFKWYQRLAHNLTPPLCVAAAVALQPSVSRRVRALLGFAALAAAAAVVLTLSRAAWVSLALALGLVALLAGRTRRFAVSLALAAMAAMVAHPAVRARLARLAVPGDNDDRLVIWRVCREMVADRPLTGYGFGNLPQRSVPYYARFAPDWWRMKAWCHDTFFSAWAEGGPLLFAAVCAFWALLARAAWRFGRGGDPLARAAAAGALGAVAATVANSLAHDLLYSSEATYGLGFALGIAAALAGPGASSAASGARNDGT